MSDFDNKVLEIRRAIAKLAPTPCEQHGLASAVFHHFDYKLRMFEMEKHTPKAQMTLPESLKIEDGEAITREFSVKFTAEVPDKVAPEKDKEWISQCGGDKIIMKHVKKKAAKKTTKSK